MRHDFPAKIIRLLQTRVGHCCSNPGCRRPTTGPAHEEGRTVNIGVASHITAAAEGGPRYDATLTAEARRSANNGIWLCQVCAKLIDSDIARFTVAVLRDWKQQAVGRAFRAIATARAAAPPSTFEADAADRAFIAGLALPSQDTVDAVAERAFLAAATDVAAFRNAREWPAHAVALNLMLHGNDAQSPITLDGIAAAIGVADGVSLVSPPGTGKSTTLVQLAERTLAARALVPLIVPLGEWSDRTDSFFDFVTRRNAFGNFRRQHFMQLAYYGRLALILDGWNELDPNSRTRAIRDLQALRRDYPQIAVVIATRRHALPIEGAVVEIEPLSDGQQLEIARAQRGVEGEALVDQAWRSPGVRELIATPLYLNALLAIPSGSYFPRTKEELLRVFVTAHEQGPENAEVLRKELQAFHKDMLVELAIQANRSANTSIPEASARQAISTVGNRLAADGQLTVPPQPTRAIDVLVGSHVLVRPPSGAGAVMFQHQQFQEWFASYEVERLMLSAAQGDVVAMKSLREDVLDWPAWEESILFACERLSRDSPAGAGAVAKAVSEALGIDPMLAAEMIYRSAPELWPLLRGQVTALVERWHSPGKVDRAFRFMVTTGRPEFAERVWPLVSDEDDQVHLRALRAAEPFRTAVLGSDAPAKLAALPEQTRRHVIAEIASRSGYDGMELAATLARAEPSADVVVNVLQSLQFRRADRQVTAILRVAPDDVWRELARQGYPDDLADAQLQQHLLELRKVRVTRETNPFRSLGALTSSRRDDADAAEQAAEIIRSRDFSFKDPEGSHLLRHAYEMFPAQVAGALVSRIADGLEVPYNTHEYLEHVPTVEEGPIVALALRDTPSERLISAALAIVGPKTVDKMMGELFAMNDEYARPDSKIDEAARRRYHRKKDAILATRLDSFLEALFGRAVTDKPDRIWLIADLVVRHGKGASQEKLLIIKEEVRERLVDVILGWIDVLLISPHATRHQMSEIAWVIQRLDSLKFVSKLKQMLDRDLTDHARAREEYLRERTRSPSPDVTHSYANVYQGAFAAIGGDKVIALMKEYLPNLQFGVEAARVLATLWHHAHPSGKEKSFWGWDDFSEVAEPRKAREEPQDPIPTTDSGEAIFATVRTLLREAENDAQRRHALALAQVGLGIPHGSKRPEIDRLLHLPVPYAAKQALLAAAAKAGEVLHANVLIAGLVELLEAGRKDTWRLEENRGELMGWMELFAFSDRPAAVIEAFDLLAPGHRHPWNLRRMLTSLGHSPHPDALNALQELARRDPRLAQQHEWLDAMGKVGTEPAGVALLDLVCAGSLMEGQGRVDAWQLSNYLEGFARQFPAFRNELVRRYALSTCGPGQQIPERALAKVADAHIILAMIANHAKERRTFRNSELPQAIANVAVGRRPVEDWPGAFQEFSVSLRELRKELLGLVLAANEQSTLAEACLNYIDKLRDEHGRINDEPRHPDIQTRRAWPMETGA